MHRVRAAFEAHQRTVDALQRHSFPDFFYLGFESVDDRLYGFESGPAADFLEACREHRDAQPVRTSDTALLLVHPICEFTQTEESCDSSQQRSARYRSNLEAALASLATRPDWSVRLVDTPIHYAFCTSAWAESGLLGATAFTMLRKPWLLPGEEYDFQGVRKLFVGGMYTHLCLRAVLDDLSFAKRKGLVEQLILVPELTLPSSKRRSTFRNHERPIPEEYATLPFMDDEWFLDLQDLRADVDGFARLAEIAPDTSHCQNSTLPIGSPCLSYTAMRSRV